MGDGQHGWAASEWVMMIRNLFVREETDRLVIGSGVFPDWVDTGRPVRFGPTPTEYGRIRVTIEKMQDAAEVVLETDWRMEPPAIEIRIPGYSPETITDTNHPYIKVRV